MPRKGRSRLVLPSSPHFACNLLCEGERDLCSEDAPLAVALRLWRQLSLRFGMGAWRCQASCRRFAVWLNPEPKYLTMRCAIFTPSLTKVVADNGSETHLAPSNTPMRFERGNASAGQRSVARSSVHCARILVLPK